MTTAYINQIATAVPQHDIHHKFVEYALPLLSDDRSRGLFKRMAERAQIDHRYSIFSPHFDPQKLDTEEFYVTGAFPGTKARMALYKEHAPKLVFAALDKLGFALDQKGITHLILTSCTGFYAPGLDVQIIQHYKLEPHVERTIVGFMGCYAAINALKLAHHIVRSQPHSRVLVINLELCTLHLQETPNLEEVLSFLIFSDGCAACVISAQPSGIELKSFSSQILPDSGQQISWHIGNNGFEMSLSGKVSGILATELKRYIPLILDGAHMRDITHWAVHPGGRSILDAVENGLHLGKDQLSVSRSVLARYGNMSSAAIMFVLKDMLSGPAGKGCALAFGPGLGIESMIFDIKGT